MKDWYVICNSPEAIMREAVEAFLSGRNDKLAELRHRDVMAVARRRLFKVLDGSVRFHHHRVVVGL